MTGCSKSDNQFEALLPAEATSVSYMRESDSSEGVTFQVQSEPGAYRYIEPLREKVIASGYVLCKKSALSEWTPKPVESGKPGNHAFWLTELYTTKDHTKFFVIRVDGTPADGGVSWRQGFRLATQTVGQGKQNIGSINEFCD